ncbi:hypothetical protein T492DRAFT_834331 [Pavlovales sp. CCMP2436]|nr:hypothetical protein T492DRAFT_834331 [Pavlovales sp. CCMP2436]
MVTLLTSPPSIIRLAPLLRLRTCIYARAAAPLLPHLAEDLWQNLPYRDELTADSVFLSFAADSVFLSICCSSSTFVAAAVIAVGWTAGAVDAAAAEATATSLAGWAAVRAVSFMIVSRRI